MLSPASLTRSKNGFISTLGLLASIKNIKQNIVEGWFHENSIKILPLISKAPPPLLLIKRQNFNDIIPIL